MDGARNISRHGIVFPQNPPAEANRRAFPGCAAPFPLELLTHHGQSAPVQFSGYGHLRHRVARAFHKRSISCRAVHANFRECV
jgi:hypothetical protein